MLVTGGQCGELVALQPPEHLVHPISWEQVAQEIPRLSDENVTRRAAECLVDPRQLVDSEINQVGWLSVPRRQVKQAGTDLQGAPAVVETRQIVVERRRAQ